MAGGGVGASCPLPTANCKVDQLYNFDVGVRVHEIAHDRHPPGRNCKIDKINNLLLSSILQLYSFDLEGSNRVLFHTLRGQTRNCKVDQLYNLRPNPDIYHKHELFHAWGGRHARGKPFTRIAQTSEFEPMFLFSPLRKPPHRRWSTWTLHFFMVSLGNPYQQLGSEPKADGCNISV